MSRLAIVGASARAAATSARRAGLEPVCMDLFGDADLRTFADVTVCPLADFPARLPALVRALPPGPWLYTGGLENHPDVIAAISAARELLGNGPAVLAKVRDPAWLSSLPDTIGITYPPTYRDGDRVPAGRYVRKPIASAGGRGMSLVDVAADDAATPGRGHVWQRFIDGPAMSAVYVGDKLFGVTRQLVADPRCHAKSFAYCGSVGPVADTAVSVELATVGRELARVAGLRGVWNADFVFADGTPHLIEINPRYSASVEVLEWATGRNVFDTTSRHEPVARVVGKLVYFATNRVVMPASGPWCDTIRDMPRFADLPAAGCVIEPGLPVLTAFALSDMPAECEANLWATAAELDRLFAEG